MAPNVTLHFFRNKAINGPVLLEITDEDEYFKELTLRPELYSVGGAELVLARRVGMHLLSTDAVAPEAFCRVLVHAYSDTEYFTGFFLDKRNQVVVDPDEDGGEEFHFGGPGPKYYLDRAVLGIVDHLGAGWHLDLENGNWRWMETATAGRILNRIIAEDAAKDDPALPDMTQSFDAGDDSNGDPWTTDIAGADEYEIPIGRTYLQILFDLEDASGLQSRVNLGTVSAPVFELEGFNDGAMGEDVTATSFAAGKVILREGVNIGDTSLELEGRSLKKPSHVIVEGKDHTYEFVQKAGFSSGDFVKYDFITYPSSKNATVLHRVGQRYLLRQERADKALTVPIVPGASEGTGFYFPKPSGPLWVGNTITVDTAADGTTPTPVDLDNEDELVTGFELKLGPAGDTATADKKAKSWDVKVKLNIERGGNPSHPDQTTIRSSNGGCHCMQLCEVDPAPSCSTDVALMTQISTPNGGFETGTDANWTHNQLGGTGIVGPGSGDWDGSYYYSGGSAGYHFYTVPAGYVFRAGQAYVARIRGADTGANTVVRFGYQPLSETDIAEDQATAPGGGQWVDFCEVWTPSADRSSGVGVGLFVESGLDNFDLDDVRIYSGGPNTEEFVGTEKGAAHCDHQHHAENIIFSDGDTLEEKIAALAPVDLSAIPFLVTTASGDLSNEVVVGVTPGGELGGTWPSPTVDATHSGSSHAGIQSAAEAAANAYTDAAIVAAPIYRPVMAFDPVDSHWYVVVDGDGTAVMTSG